MWIDRLTASQADAVQALAARAQAADGVDPLNEEARLSLSPSDVATARHLLVPAGDRVVAYLHHDPRLSTAQLVVDPVERRRGLGSRLWRQAGLPPETGVWAFGDLEPARGFASAHGLCAERTLLMMARELTDLPTAAPSALRLRGFRPGDESAVLSVNAAAFAHHHEQGALDLTGLAARMAEPWFDPDGLILGFDDDGLAGFHWTKADEGVGEVYVVAVAPRAQGRGYGRSLLNAGLSHLAAKGLATVLLYVDGADEIAVTMYERAGFRTEHRDVFYVAEKQEQ